MLCRPAFPQSGDEAYFMDGTMGWGGGGCLADVWKMFAFASNYSNRPP